MASLTVKEYRELARDATGAIMAAPKEPPLRKQSVALSTSSAAMTNATGNDCFLLGITPDADCYVEIAAAPTAAVATSEFFAAGVTKYVGVSPNAALKVAAITSA